MQPRGARFPQVDRLVAAGVFGILCAFTLTIAAKPEWPLYLLEAAVGALFALWLLFHEELALSPRAGFTVIALCAVTLWGLVQYLAHWTSERQATLSATLQWFAILAMFVMCEHVFARPATRTSFLNLSVWFGVLLSVLELAGAARPSGDFLWLLPTGYPRLYASFQSYNNFAQFQELLIPVAAFRAFTSGERIWAFATGLLYASVVTSGSRAGVILTSAEILAVWVLSRAALPGFPGRAVPRLAVIVAVAGVLTFVSWGDLGKRFEQDHPLAERALLNQSSLSMIASRPVVGFGLGSYSTVYPAFARFDVGRVVNYAHNDWAEWAVEGGLPFVVLIAAIAVASLRPAVQSIWGLGLVAVCIHAVIDYPFRRLGVEAWIFVLLAAVHVRQQRVPNAPLPVPCDKEMAISTIGELV